MSSRAKRRGRTQDKVQLSPTKTQLKTEKSPWQWFGILSPTGKLAAAIALILTVAGSYFSFSPKIFVEASYPMETKNLFTTPFVISNDGVLPVHSVSYHIIIRRAVNEIGGTVIANKGKGMQPTEYLVPILQAGEKATTGIPSPFGNIVSGDIDFVVSYRPSFIPWTQEKIFRFGSSKESDGKLVWRHRASSETD